MSTGRTRSHVATWTVLVAIDEPAAETGLQRKLQQFEAVLKLHHQQNALSNVTRQIWVERIRQIESTMISPKGGRTRRGLFNIIGEISRKLFGTATEEEVDETRRRIDADRSGLRQSTSAVPTRYHRGGSKTTKPMQSDNQQTERGNRDGTRTNARYHRILYQRRNVLAVLCRSH